MFLSGMVTTTMSPAAAASAGVAACASGPSSATRPASVSGPRELLITTLWPWATASRATWLPICPAPIKPMVLLIGALRDNRSLYAAAPHGEGTNVVQRGESMSIPHRTLGRTGQTVSAIGVDGWHLDLHTVSEDLSLRIVRTAIDRGITFMDNSWGYNDGASEIRMG